MTNNTTSEVVKIRRKVYMKLVELVQKDELEEKVESIPKELANDETPRHRCCEFKERAILKDRIKLAMGFNPKDYPETRLSELTKKIDKVKTDFNSIQVLELACDRCPIDKYMVTNACRNCVAHKCVNSCPKDAIVIIQGPAYIDQNKCIECGRCAAECPYDAIHENNRPCVKACEVDAIKSDENRKADINKEKCVNCGSCITACPFGAIDYVSYVVQVLNQLKDPEVEVAALIAPSFTGQFGVRISPGTVKTALKKLGFNEVTEVAFGADLVIQEESGELIEKMEKGENYMTSSCCPGFKDLIDRHYPDLKEYVSTTSSPMVKSAQYIKETNPEINTVFIGPCVAKKSEAAKYDCIDYVLTFEELLSIMVGCGLNLEEIEDKENFKEVTELGRSFPYSGGVSKAINEYIDQNRLNNNKYQLTSGKGLEECKEKLELIKAGKAEFDFLEGMACKEGCVGGPGNLIKSVVAKKLVDNFAKEAEDRLPEPSTFEKIHRESY